MKNPTVTILNNRIIPVMLLAFGMLVSGGLEAQSVEIGTASYYHNKFIGRKTANGQIFDQNKLTAAHKSLPLGTWVKVTNLGNDSSVIVQINDRMPQWNKRSIDLTKKAASQLDYLHDGLAKVSIEIIPDPNNVEVTVQRDNYIPAYIDLVVVNSLRAEASAAVYPKLPVIQYVVMEKPKGGLFNFQR